MRRLILVALLVTTLLAQERLNISARPSAIQPGESTTLTWQTQGQTAFLSGVGTVPPSGSMVVTPRVSTTYTLVSEGTQRVEFVSTTVAVVGERGGGDADFPNPRDFPEGLSGQRHSIRYTTFLDLAFKTLQDQMKFRVNSLHAPHDPFYVFITDRQPRPDLVHASDRGIRSRRLAYEVQIFDPKNAASAIPFEVKAILEYQRLGEAAWHFETNEELTREALAQLKQTLDTSP